MSWLSAVIGGSSAALCLVQKVPQILTILRSGSARGISLNSLLLELWSYTSTVSYSVGRSSPFSSYCEYPALVIQDLVLLFFLLRYRHLFGLTSISIFLVFVAFQISLASGVMSSFILTLVVSGNVPISATSKVLQLASILKSKDAGDVSPTSWVIGALTSAARLYTFTVDVWSLPLAVNMLCSTVLNIAVCTSAIVYRPCPAAKGKKQKFS